MYIAFSQVFTSDCGNHAHDFSESGIENKSHSCHVEYILHPGAILPPCVVPESLPRVKDLFTELCSE